jgi:hypothetical protein
LFFKWLKRDAAVTALLTVSTSGVGVTFRPPTSIHKDNPGEFRVSYLQGL